MTHFQRNPVLSEKEIKVRLYAMMVMGSILGDGSDLREPLAMQRARKFLDDPRVDAWFRHPRAFTPLRWADGDSQDQQLAFVLPGAGSSQVAGSSGREQELRDTALVALFNFSGRQEFRETFSRQDLSLKPGRYIIRDFITDEAVGTIAAGQLVFSLSVAEKDALLVRLVPDGRPGQ